MSNKQRPRGKNADYYILDKDPSFDPRSGPSGRAGRWLGTMAKFDNDFNGSLLIDSESASETTGVIKGQFIVKNGAKLTEKYRHVAD